MIATSHHHEIAREVPSPRLSDRPAGGCLLPAPRPVAIIDNQHQTDSHSRGGAPLGLRCDYRPAVGGTSRRVSFIRALGGYDLPDCNLAGAFIGAGPFGQFDGIEAGTSHLVANLIQHRRQRGFQAFAERLPSHSSAPAVYVLKRRCGVIGSAQKAIGVSQNVYC